MRATSARLCSAAHALAAISLLGTGMPLQAERALAAGEARPEIAHLVPIGPWTDSAAASRGASIDPVQAAKTDRIVLATGKDKKGVWFETGSLNSVLAALATCTDDSLAQWGLGPKQHRSYVPPAMCNTVEPATFFLRNYPERAAANRKSGVFSFRVIIEPVGTVPCCHIEARTKAGDLDPRCKDIVRICEV